MDNRYLPGAQRPPPLQRAVSGSGIGFPSYAHRPYVNSRLGGRANVRSVSQPTSHMLRGLERANRNDLPPLLTETTVVSPETILIEDTDYEPPAKRAKTRGDTFRPEHGQDEAWEDKANELVAGSPLPSLPSIIDHRSHRDPPAKGARSHGESITRKSHGLEPPPIATRVPLPKKVADFAPWNGQHAEDILNETVVKSGYFDKIANQNESNSARPSIWPTLSQKNHVGLSTLSYLFSQVLEKRQALGKCTTPSTFKPPPRVTVTDTKREAWLRDLANPDIPLRKQSRTIPHGIRGKVLMEQCLSKDIPLPRAVWLAKCVGANELRAFKRKGVSGPASASGEIKWVREWTVAVEQFLDGVVATCGAPDWQAHINYAMKLATSFYVERLLDLDHFLDWILSSLADTSTERLPIWIIYTQLFFMDITRYLTRGKRLADIVLQRLHSFATDGSTIHNALRSRLRKLLGSLAATNLDCLIIPSTWTRNRPFLEALPTFNQIQRRTERITGPSTTTSTNGESSLMKLYTMLDGLGINFKVEDVSQACFEIVPEPDKLLPAVLEWCCTPYRIGLARIYTTAKIISDLYKPNHETDFAILEFMKDETRPALILGQRLYLTIARLIELKSFSIGIYLQRLITHATGSEGHHNLTSGLLNALPLHQLPMHTRNLRKTMLQRLHVTEHDAAVVTTIISSFDEELVGANARQLPVVYPRKPADVSAILAIRAHIREALHARSGDTIDMGTFCYFRGWMEWAEDMVSLFDLLSRAVVTEDLSILATITDTLNMYAECAVALGALQTLTDTLRTKYRLMRSQQPLEKMFIVALTDLCSRMPDEDDFLKTLEMDLPICEQQSISTVCSPVSDNLIGVQVNNLQSDADIDAVFASGNSMDQQLMERLFSRILSRLSKVDSSWALRVCGWLRQLRCFEFTIFDQLATRLVENFLQENGDMLTCMQGVRALIASGCTSFVHVAELAEKLGTSRSADLLLRMDSEEAPHIFAPQDCFRYKVMSYRFRDEHSEQVLRLCRRALEQDPLGVDVDSVADLAIKYISRAPLDQKNPFTEPGGGSDVLLANTARIFVHLVKRGVPDAAGETLDPSWIMRLNNPLCVKIGVRALAFFMDFDRFNIENGDNTIVNLLQAAVQDGTSVWQPLVDAANQSVKKVLHGWAQDHLLFSVDKDIDTKQAGVIDRFLEVLDITRGALDSGDNQAVVVVLVDKFREVQTKLATHENQPASLGSLRFLLRICAQAATGQSGDSEVSNQAHANLVMVLLGFLAHPQIQLQRDTYDFCFDLASVLFDALPEVSVAMVVKSMVSTRAEPCIMSIIGNVGAVASDSWLALSSPVRPVGSQQQQALAKHSAQQGLPSSRTPVNVAGQTTPAQPRNWLGQSNVPKATVEMKTTAYSLRRWELMPDPTPSMGENDASLSLALFGARKV